MRSRILKIAIGAVATSSLTLGLAGCGSSGDGTPTKPSGIATVLCDKARKLITVKVINPDNGKVTKTAYFGLAGKQHTEICSLSNVNIVRSTFNADYSLMAVRQQEGQTGWHTGVLEATADPAKPSKFRDLSDDEGKLTAPVQQSSGAFGPDGKLYAIEQTTPAASEDDPGSHVLRVIDPASGKVEIRHEQVTFLDTREDGSSYNKVASFDRYFYFLPYSKKLETGGSNKVLSPEGDWGFWKNYNDDFVRGDLQKVADGKTTVIENPHLPDGSEGRATITPFMYVARDQFLGSAHGGKIYLVTTPREGEATLKEIKLDASEPWGMIASPDGKRFAFAVTTSQTTGTLRIAPITGGASRVASTIDALPMEWVG